MVVALKNLNLDQNFIDLTLKQGSGFVNLTGFSVFFKVFPTPLATVPIYTLTNSDYITLTPLIGKVHISLSSLLVDRVFNYKLGWIDTSGNTKLLLKGSIVVNG